MVKDFYEELNNRGMYDILKEVSYVPPSFSNYSKVNQILEEISYNTDSKILVYGDYDLDGLMFTMITIDFLETLMCSNYDIFQYRKRTHDLDRQAVRQCIQGKYKYFIVGDTASSDISTLNELVSYGIKVLVIDHHVTDISYSDYPDGVYVLNSQLENNEIGEERYQCSAAALAYLVYDIFAKEHGLIFKNASCAYALVSLYSDCMNMSNELNRAIYYKAASLDREDLPHYILHFLNEYQAFTARFISFWYAPRINALFRSENFELVNKYFFAAIDADERAKCISEINDIYLKNREQTKLLVDLIDVQEEKNFIIADLSTATMKCDNNIIKSPENYTGLVANKLSERYKKTAIVLAETFDYYKGSLRDLYSKAYLPLFRKICFAAGHNAAFGLKIPLLGFDEFIEKVKRIDKKYSIDSIPNEPIIVQHEYTEPDIGLIQDMALYNEFSGSEIPVAYLSKQLIGNMPESKNSYYYKYDWGYDFFIQSDSSINFGTKMKIKPVLGKRIKLINS